MNASRRSKARDLFDFSDVAADVFAGQEEAKASETAAGPISLAYYPELEDRLVRIRDAEGRLRDGWAREFYAPHPEWDRIRSLAPMRVPEDVMVLDSLLRATRSPVSPTPEQRTEQAALRDEIVKLSTRVATRRQIRSWLLDAHARQTRCPLAPTAPRRTMGRAPRRAVRVVRVARVDNDDGDGPPPEPPGRRVSESRDAP